MQDYICREAALDALCEAVHRKDGDVPCRNQLASCLWTGTRTQEYAERILAVPAADVRPVVLCRDCRNCEKADDWEYWCLGWGSPARLVRPEDWCSCGKRKA